MDFFRGFLLSARSTYRLPVFAAKRVRILGSPEEFYAELKARIRTARRHVSLPYIGCNRVLISEMAWAKQRATGTDMVRVKRLDFGLAFHSEAACR